MVILGTCNKNIIDDSRLCKFGTLKQQIFTVHIISAGFSRYFGFKLCFPIWAQKRRIFVYCRGLRKPSRVKARRNGSSVHNTELSKLILPSGDVMTPPHVTQMASNTDSAPQKCALKTSPTP